MYSFEKFRFQILFYADLVWVTIINFKIEVITLNSLTMLITVQHLQDKS